MIYFVIGTKAQFIKLAPVMSVMDSRSLDYRLIDLSQHGALTGRILQDFQLAPRTTSFCASCGNVTTYRKALRWLTCAGWNLLQGRRRIRRRYFDGGDGVVVVHGDTLSTLIGMLLAKRAGLKVALVEAGLTSGHLFEPFPEELVRRIVEKRSSFLFTPDATSARHLSEKGLRGEVVNTGYNTGRDALAAMFINYRAHEHKADVDYVVVTVHRLETISNRQKLSRTIEYLESMAGTIGQIRFYMHPPTERALKRFGLRERVLAIPGIAISELLPYPEFVLELIGSKAIFTDGGSIQEEASYLRRPCVILRSRTERENGLGDNAILTSGAFATDWAYCERYASAHRNDDVDLSFAASNTIIDTLTAPR